MTKTNIHAASSAVFDKIQNKENTMTNTNNAPVLPIDNDVLSDLKLSLSMAENVVERDRKSLAAYTRSLIEEATSMAEKVNAKSDNWHLATTLTERASYIDQLRNRLGVKIDEVHHLTYLINREALRAH
jgi:hypothetical protein